MIHFNPLEAVLFFVTMSSSHFACEPLSIISNEEIIFQYLKEVFLQFDRVCRVFLTCSYRQSHDTVLPVAEGVILCHGDCF